MIIDQKIPNPRASMFDKIDHRNQKLFYKKYRLDENNNFHPNKT